MKVYIVQGGWDYEGCDVSSMRAFDSMEKAKAGKELLENDAASSYDYVVLSELEVE